MAGLYLILSDTNEGAFPPRFSDQEKVFDNERNYLLSVPGVDRDELFTSEMRKPFWNGQVGTDLFLNYLKLKRAFEKLNIGPGSSVLELGCGTGWMAEFMALIGYRMTATSISEQEINMARLRCASIRSKNLPLYLEYDPAPMEFIDQYAKGKCFDAIYVFEALHHAYDWRKAINAAYSCLSPGGWLFICNEPNVIHSLTSYRVARLMNTHEIGFKRSDLTSHLKKAGFQKIKCLYNRVDDFIRPHWIAAQR